MALTTSYLITARNLGSILQSIQTAQAPKKFTVSFLESLDFKSTNDRLVIGLLKALGFLTDSGEPTDRYYRYLDQSVGGRVLAEGIREAYADLFAVNINAQSMTKTEVKNKLKTLTQGKPSDNVLTLMASTFEALCNLADFSQPEGATQMGADNRGKTEDKRKQQGEPPPEITKIKPPPQIASFQYVINLQLPDSRDQAVFDALFRSLKEHLLQ